MKIEKVNINNLLPFNENPYRIREGEELESLLDSISTKPNGSHSNPR